MIEVEELKTELEQPTEIDIRLLFADLQKPMEALQKIFASEIDKLTKENINTIYAGLEIKHNQLIVRLGDFVLYHTVNDTIYDLKKARE